MPVHQIRQGEHLARIIRQYGFTDLDEVWGHPDNQRLRDRGRTPGTLAPGDLVTIPEMTTKTVGRGTEQRHRVQVHQRTCRLHLVLRDGQGRAVSGLACLARIEGVERAVTTEADGSIRLDIPLHLDSVELTVGTCASPLSDARFTILVGHLDPVEVIPGQEARLNNLGYRAGEAGDPEAASFRSAVEEFQCDHGLHVDGRCGPNTQRKLVEVHGC